MYQFLHDLLCDKKGGEIFRLFSAWHFFYIGLALAVIVIVLLVFRNKDKQKIIRFFCDLSFGLYIADFFLMPLAYGEIDIEKLPFHACTAMCVMCFLSYRVKFLEKYRLSFAKLGLVSNFVYLIYPAGVMWHAVHPLSYRVIQTLLFHCIMTIYGFLTILYEKDDRNYGRDLKVIVFMTLWALLGNYAYNGTSGDYSHFFNWFFVVRDPFDMLPPDTARFVMPFVNIILFFAVEMIINVVSGFLKRNK